MRLESVSLFTVRVIKHLPFGLLVEAENGGCGIVRLRELSWSNEKIQKWKDFFPLGWSGKALLISSKKEHLLEFSLRLTESDPWDAVLGKIGEGQVFDGIVTWVAEYGAFVEIASGVTGLLHHSQIPSWCKKTSVELFWPGDKIRVIISHIDYEQHQIGLRFAPIKPLLDEEVSISIKNSKDKQIAGKEMGALLEDNIPQRYILVVEDENRQAITLAGWLRRIGQRVDVVESAEQALDFLEKSQPDMALIDIGLPGMSGASLAQIILDKWPEVGVIIAIDWALTDEVMEPLESLQKRGAQILLKPLLPNDLVTSLLQELECKPKQLDDIMRGKLNLLDLPKLDPRKFIQAILHRCCTHLDFELVVLFSLDSFQRNVRVAEHIGGGSLNKYAIPSLIYSPIREVAEDHKVVVVNDIGSYVHARFRYLLEAFPSAVACVGVPVPTQLEFDYALFAIDKHVRQITPEQQTYVEGIAIAIGAALDQNNLREKSALMQRTALIGHLSRAMVHETNNLVGPLLYGINNIKRMFSKINDHTIEPNYELIGSEISKLQQDVRKIINMIKTFGRIVGKARYETLRVDEIIRETLDLLSDISERSHVAISFTPSDSVVIIRNQSVVLEQIFINVLLNAIQQIAEMRPEVGGWVKVNVELVQSSTEEALCRILVEDNGPGIHASLWDKIFEAGFTTRPDGSGVGLYVSRNLMEDIVGGRIYVKQSFMLGGTIFALEIPCRL